MATGIPQKSKKITTSVSLNYYGKKTTSEILHSPPAKLLEITQNNSQNKLIYADNLPVLANLAQDIAVAGKIRLIYIDPPFSTNTSFHSRKLDHAYDDVRVGEEFIEFLRERIIFLHHLLAEDGSFYLHLDERMVFHFRIILDEIFGATQFRSCITRQKCHPKNYTKNSYGNIADYILFYTKSDNYVWNRPVELWTEEKIAKEYQYVETNTGRRYKKVPIHAPGIRYGETGKMWRGMSPPPGKHWQYTPDKLDELDAKGEIYWSATGNPRRKVYLDTNEGIPVQNIWLDLKDAYNQNVHTTGYPTEKNEDILKRIILASSHEGDLVLDCFSGSGTTLATAAQLNRHWIGIDNSLQAIATTIQRLKHGLKPIGDFVNRPSKDNTLSHQSLSLFTTEELQVLEPQRMNHPFSVFTSNDNLECRTELYQLFSVA